MTDGNDWMADGLCRQVDGEVWFPEKGSSNRDAKRVCMACPVRAECLQYALDNGEQYGVWGGLSVAERIKLRKPDQRHGRILTAKQEQDIVALLRKGQPPFSIAPQFGVSPYVIYRLRNLLMNGEAA